MTKLLLIAGFVAALSMLGFAAANASRGDEMSVNGQMVAIDYD